MKRAVTRLDNLDKIVNRLAVIINNNFTTPIMQASSQQPKQMQATPANKEKHIASAHTHLHDEVEGSEFLDDALRMNEQPFETDHPDRKTTNKKKSTNN